MNFGKAHQFAGGDSMYSRDLMYGPVTSLEKVMAAMCDGRFNPDAPRSQYWPTPLPADRTPRPADFQGPGVVPITPRANIEHQTLADPVEGVVEAQEDAAPVKEEEGWEIVGLKVVRPSDEVIDITSSSESE